MTTCPKWGIRAFPIWGMETMVHEDPQRVEQEKSREGAEKAIEDLVRKATENQEGKIKDVQKHHIQTVIKSRAAEKTIGCERGAKVWGWFAKATRSNVITMKPKEWLTPHEQMINEIRANAAWEDQWLYRKRMTAQADREEALGVVRSWLSHHEEPPRGGFIVLRPEKREALRSARSNWFKRLGGAEALYGTIALLTMVGEVVMETDRGSGGERAINVSWIKQSMKWLEAMDWIPEGASENLAELATKKQDALRRGLKMREGEGEMKIMDIGEGWGSIGIAVSRIPGCATIGVDRAGFLDQGQLHGQVTSIIDTDLCSKGSMNVLRRIAKRASRKLESFTMIWLSPECRILTTANAMNVARGCTNGRLLDDPRNVMDEHTQHEKEIEYQQCLNAIENQMEALDQESNNILFAMENPATSDLWDLESVKGRISRNHSWELRTVDQCAYGRKCKKPTKILTNLANWNPRGITGDGRCKVGRCGGTVNNPEGPHQNRHEQTMITSDPKRKPREGKVVGQRGRREYSVKAGKNLVQAELVIEIVEAALATHERETENKKITRDQKPGNENRANKVNMTLGRERGGPKQGNAREPPSSGRDRRGEKRKREGME